MLENIKKSSKFKTNYIQVRFQLPAIKENTTSASLLAMYLSHCNNIDVNYKEANDKLDLLYGAKFDINVSMKGNLITFDFLFSFIAKRYLPNADNYLNEMLETISTYIFNPLVVNDSFDENTYNLKKYELEQRLKMAYDDKASYALEQFYEIMGQDYPIGLNVLGYLDELEVLTPLKLYNYYQNLMKLDYQIYADLNENDFEEINNYLTNNFNTKQSINKDVAYSLTSTKVEEVIENQNITQSKLLLGYHLEEVITNQQYYINLVFNSLFGMSSNSYLFKIIREQENLCYSINCMYDHYSNVFIVMAGIEKDNADKTSNLVNDIITKMANEDILEEDFIDAKTVLIDIIKKTYDTQGALINYTSNRSLLSFNDDIEQDIKAINKVSLNDVYQVAKSLKLKTKFLLSGDKNE